MKYLTIIFLFFSSFAMAQPNAGDSAITVQITKQGLQMFAFYISQSPQWDNRKLPDDIVAVIGTKKTPADSIVTFTFKKGNQLTKYIDFLMSDRVGVQVDLYRKIYLGQPNIANFQSLKNQLNTLSGVNSQQGRTALFIKNELQQRQDAYDALFAENIERALEWLKN